MYRPAPRPLMLIFPPGVAASYRRGEQAAGIGELAPEIGRGNAMALGQCREPVEPAGVEYVGADDERAAMSRFLSDDALAAQIETIGRLHAKFDREMRA
jgi:hypothetical protein